MFVFVVKCDHPPGAKNASSVTLMRKVSRLHPDIVATQAGGPEGDIRGMLTNLRPIVRWELII